MKSLASRAALTPTLSHKREREFSLLPLPLGEGWGEGWRITRIGPVWTLH
jgi:hypothetical protein